MDKRKLLAHICCAPDAAYVIGLLKEEFEVSGFFYNPNIHPVEEYYRRLQEMRRLAGLLRIPLIEGAYDEAEWFERVAGLEAEPEKGRRCDVCYSMRLEKTARLAAERSDDIFATVMSLSPWKKADVLNALGLKLGRAHGTAFLQADFKKKDGFRKSLELSRSLGLYRQNYCGCIYSLRNREAAGTKKGPGQS